MSGSITTAAAFPAAFRAYEATIAATRSCRFASIVSRTSRGRFRNRANAALFGSYRWRKAGHNLRDSHAGWSASAGQSCRLFESWKHGQRSRASDLRHRARCTRYWARSS